MIKFKMHINDEYLNSIKKGTKKFEVRLCHKYRDIICKDDELILIGNDSHNEVSVKVLGTKRFQNLDQLVNEVNAADLGMEGMTKQQIKDVYLSFYTKEQITKYGLVSIKVN